MDYLDLQKHQIGLLINYSSMSQISPTKKNLCVFSLLRLRKDCYFAPVNVDYTPFKSVNQTEKSILPQFNLDKNFFTPAFILPYENSFSKENLITKIDRERVKFLQKVQACERSISEQSPVFNPRDDNYCALCQASFKCYWAHINSKKHTNHIKGNRVNSYIHELASKYKSNKIKEGEKEKGIESNVSKKKKIKKRERKCQSIKQKESFNKEDFIIKLPSDLFEKEAQQINYNISTNNVNSMQRNLLKM